MQMTLYYVFCTPWYWSVGGNVGRVGAMAPEPMIKRGKGICVRLAINIRLLVMLNRNFVNYAQK
jgi:hypothetical protein